MQLSINNWACGCTWSMLLVLLTNECVEFPLAHDQRTFDPVFLQQSDCLVSIFLPLNCFVHFINVILEDSSLVSYQY